MSSYKYDFVFSNEFRGKKGNMSGWVVLVRNHSDISNLNLDNICKEFLCHLLDIEMRKGNDCLAVNKFGAFFVVPKIDDLMNEMVCNCTIENFDNSIGGQWLA